MSRTFILQLLLITSLVVLFASCSQNENPSSPSQADQQITLTKPTPSQTYTATHSQLGSATSYILGAPNGLNFELNKHTACTGLGSFSGTGTLTFFGLIGDKIREHCGYGGTGSIQIINCSLVTPADCMGVVEKLGFQNGNYKYRVHIGTANSQGTITGGLPTFTMTFNNVRFWIQKASLNSNNWSTVFNASSTPNGVNYQIITSQP